MIKITFNFKCFKKYFDRINQYYSKSIFNFANIVYGKYHFLRPKSISNYQNYILDSILQLSLIVIK